MTRIYRLILLSLFCLLSINIPAAENHVSFLPMEDGLSSSRRAVYGASVENVKPYREPMPMKDVQMSSYFDFGSEDVLLCVFLMGVYVLLGHRKTNIRKTGI